MTRVNIAQPDVTLTLDMDGVIRGATLSDAIPGEQMQAWLGRPWAETVGTVGVDRVRNMVQGRPRPPASPPSTSSPSASRAASSCRWNTPPSGSAGRPG